MALARAAKIPARMVAGSKSGARRRRHARWSGSRCLTERRWEAYDPENGYAPTERRPRHCPTTSWLPGTTASDIMRGPERDVLAAPAVLAGASAAARRDPGRRGRRPLDILDLTRLPLEMHEVLSLILLMPLGALVTAVFRTLIGIRTFGTFTPDAAGPELRLFATGGPAWWCSSWWSCLGLVSRTLSTG